MHHFGSSKIKCSQKNFSWEGAEFQKFIIHRAFFNGGVRPVCMHLDYSTGYLLPPLAQIPGNFAYQDLGKWEKVTQCFHGSCLIEHFGSFEKVPNVIVSTVSFHSSTYPRRHVLALFACINRV